MSFWSELVGLGIQAAKEAIDDAITKQNIENCKSFLIEFECSICSGFSDKELRNNILWNLLCDLGKLLRIEMKYTRYINWDLLTDEEGFCSAFVITDGLIVAQFGMYGCAATALYVSGPNCGRLLSPISAIISENHLYVTNTVFDKIPSFHEQSWLHRMEKELKYAIEITSDDSETDDEPSVAEIVTTWSTKEFENGFKFNLYFFSNNTFSMEFCRNFMSLDYIFGIYSGNTEKDGSLSLVITNVPEDDIEEKFSHIDTNGDNAENCTWEWKKVEYPAQIKIKDNCLLFSGCSNDFDLNGLVFQQSKDATGIISKWVCNHNDESGYTSFLSFYHNNTFKWEMSVGNIRVDSLLGSYSGDISKNGTVLLTIEKKINGDRFEKRHDITEININGQTLIFFQIYGDGTVEFTNLFGSPSTQTNENIEPTATAILEKKSEKDIQLSESTQTDSTSVTLKNEKVDAKSLIEVFYRKKSIEIGKKSTLVFLAFESPKKIGQLSKSYAKNVGMDERPILIYDNSVAENCKSGFLITDTHVWAKNSLSFSTMCWSISEINEVTVQNGIFCKTINFNGKEVETEQIGGKGTECLFELVQFIIQKIKDDCDFSSIPTLKEIFNNYL